MMCLRGVLEQLGPSQGRMTSHTDLEGAEESRIQPLYSEGRLYLESLQSKVQGLYTNAPTGPIE